MNYSSIIETTNRHFTYETLKILMGTWYADMWLAYNDSTARHEHLQQAKSLNHRRGLFKRNLRLNDRRTRGYKYLMAAKKAWEDDYRADYPEPPRPKLTGLRGLIS